MNHFPKYASTAIITFSLIGVMGLLCHCAPPTKETDTCDNDSHENLDHQQAPALNPFEQHDIAIDSQDISYHLSVEMIDDQRQKLAIAYQNNSVSIDSVRSFFTESIVNTLLPYWYGTPWDFNGHTNQPQKGTIACGYLVSTTLKHLGLNINRYKLAQQSALNEIKTLEFGQPKHYLSNTNAHSAVAYVKNQLKDGLYLVGMDFHVGYLYKHQNEVFFLHASYLEPVAAIAEIAIESEAFNSSSTYVIGNLTHNDKLLKQWLYGIRIEIIMD